MSSSTSQPHTMTSQAAATEQASSARADAHHWISLALAGVLGPLGFLHWAWQRETQKAKGQAFGLTLMWLAQAALAWWWLPPQLLQTKWYIVLVPLTANAIAMAWLLAVAFWPREPQENRGTYLLGHALHILALEAWFIALNGLHTSPFAMTLRTSAPLVLGVAPPLAGYGSRSVTQRASTQGQRSPMARMVSGAQYVGSSLLAVSACGNASTTLRTLR